MTNETIAIQLSFMVVAIVFAYLAINFMDSKNHGVLFPFFLIGTIVMLIVMVDNDHKIINQSATNINSTLTNVTAVYTGLNNILYVIIAYVFIFLLYSIGNYIVSRKEFNQGIRGQGLKKPPKK